MVSQSVWTDWIDKPKKKQYKRVYDLIIDSDRSIIISDVGKNSEELLMKNSFGVFEQLLCKDSNMKSCILIFLFSCFTGKPLIESLILCAMYSICDRSFSADL